MTSETEETVLDLEAIARELLANFNAYRESDLSHSSAHNIMVDYKLYAKLAAALSRAPEAEELGSSTRMTSPDSRSQTSLSDGEGGIYTASKTTHADRWKRARATGLPIIATWIDESGVGETACFVDLWDRCIGEAAGAGCVVLYRETGETLKGALVEAGAALAAGKLVLFAGDPDGLGSFLSHRNVERCDDLAHAFQRAQAVCDRLADERSAHAGPLSPPSTGGEGEAVAWRILDQFGTALALCARRPADLIVGEILQPLYLHPSPEMGEISREEIAREIDAEAFSKNPWDATEALAMSKRRVAALDNADAKLKENGLSREELGGSSGAGSGAAGPSDCADGDQPSVAGCTMGVGCEEAGICYAAANGQPDRCGGSLSAQNTGGGRV